MDVSLWGQQWTWIYQVICDDAQQEHTFRAARGSARSGYSCAFPSAPLSSVETAPLAMGTLPCPLHVVLVSLPVSVNIPLHQHSRVCEHTHSQWDSPSPWLENK